MRDRYVWVNIIGGIMGFERWQIEAFRQEYKAMKEQGVSYWDFFNYYFADQLDGRIATGYSARYN